MKSATRPFSGNHTRRPELLSKDVHSVSPKGLDVIFFTTDLDRVLQNAFALKYTLQSDFSEFFFH